VWAAASKDYDTLIFGTPRLLRFLTISGKEFLPSQNTFRPIVPEVLDLEQQLQSWRISREGLVDLAILVGTDFNDGVKGIGPKKALKLVQDHGRIENMPTAIRDAVGDVENIREIYLRPNVVDVAPIEFRSPDRDAIRAFLCESRQFSPERVTAALDRAFPSPTLF
jgi:flap endonuclease-1